MGERLAREAESLFKAKVEQVPLWQKAMQQGGTTLAETPELLLALFGVMREVVLYVASEVDDPSRSDNP